MSGAKIYINKKEVKVSEDGFFVFGIDKDRKLDITIIEKIDNKSKKIVKKVLKENIRFKELMVFLKKSYTSRRILRKNQKRK